MESVLVLRYNKFVKLREEFDKLKKYAGKLHNDKVVNIINRIDTSFDDIEQDNDK